MSKYRQAARIDANQPEIVDTLRKIPGVKVELSHDDILVGYKGKTYWFEIKVSEKAKKKDSQLELEQNWPGHYKIVWDIEQIFNELGIK